MGLFRVNKALNDEIDGFILDWMVEFYEGMSPFEIGDVIDFDGEIACIEREVDKLVQFADQRSLGRWKRGRIYSAVNENFASMGPMGRVENLALQFIQNKVVHRLS